MRRSRRNSICTLSVRDASSTWIGRASIPRTLPAQSVMGHGFRHGRPLLAMNEVVLRGSRKASAPAPLTESEALDRLEQIGRLGLLNVFQQAAFFTQPGVVVRRTEIATALRLAPKYERALDALLA